MKSLVLSDHELNSFLTTDQVLKLIVGNEYKKTNVNSWLSRLTALESLTTKMLFQLVEYKRKFPKETQKHEAMQEKINILHDVNKMCLELIGAYEKHKRELLQSNGEKLTLEWKVKSLQSEIELQKQVNNL